MKLLFDQNLSHRLVQAVAAEFPGSAHVRDVGLETASDLDVWNHAKGEGLIIVSKDTDFQQFALLYGHPPKVVWINLGNCDTTAVAALLMSEAITIRDFAADANASFLVLP
jgi:predicted nuclease of predicted toxin-antitoxin system